MMVFIWLPLEEMVFFWICFSGLQYWFYAGNLSRVGAWECRISTSIWLLERTTYMWRKKLLWGSSLLCLEVRSSVSLHVYMLIWCLCLDVILRCSLEPSFTCCNFSNTTSWNRLVHKISERFLFKGLPKKV